MTRENDLQRATLRFPGNSATSDVVSIEGTLALTAEFENAALDTRSSHEEVFPYLSFAAQ